MSRLVKICNWMLKTVYLLLHYFIKDINDNINKSILCSLISAIAVDITIQACFTSTRQTELHSIIIL